MPNSLELNVSPALLHTFANHPFHVRKDMEMNELVDSIRESGVIVPLIVRSRPEGGYEIISGHRRCEACRELGIEKVPVRVQELTDDEATILMVNSNIQREHLFSNHEQKNLLRDPQQVASRMLSLVRNTVQDILVSSQYSIHYCCKRIRQNSFQYFGIFLILCAD